jgi:hypothetical protein
MSADKENLIIPDSQDLTVKPKKSVGIYISITAFVVVFLVAIILVLIYFPARQAANAEQSNVILNGIQQDTSEQIFKTSLWQDLKIPKELPAWLLVPYHVWPYQNDLPQLQEQAKAWSQNSSIVNYFDEIDFSNLEYSQEDLEYFFAISVNRIINPIFGGWENYQVHNIFFQSGGFINPDNHPEVVINHELEFDENGRWLGEILRLEDVFAPDLWRAIKAYYSAPMMHPYLPLPITSIEIVDFMDETALKNLLKLNEEESLVQFEEKPTSYIFGFIGAADTQNIVIESNAVNSQTFWNFRIPVIYTGFVSENKIVQTTGNLFLQISNTNEALYIFDYHLILD